MNILLLGAGRPAKGESPSALKTLSLHMRAMDWQLHSFSGIASPLDIQYLGGYRIDEVATLYPQLRFVLVPDWDRNSILHTLFHGTTRAADTLIAYSDTVFRKEAIERLLQQGTDVAYGVDSGWRQRYPLRAAADIGVAEVVASEEPSQPGVEFTGLIYLKPHVAQYVSTLREQDVGTTLVDLLGHLQGRGFSMRAVDVRGDWAEFNAPEDIARFILGTKADTLHRLEARVSRSLIGRQASFTVAEWREAPHTALAVIRERLGEVPLVVRSSSTSEDGWRASNAGSFASVIDVDGSSPPAIAAAVESVIASYGADVAAIDQVLVQAMVEGVRCAGVVFTRGLETGSPYYRINFDDRSATTASVTSGSAAQLRTVVVHRRRPELLADLEPALRPVLDAVAEVEDILGYDKLDVEFAVDADGRVHLFQVRPITVDHSAFEYAEEEFASRLAWDVSRFHALQAPSPFVVGSGTLFGNMPDWNPAEIIGTRPKPLAASLYHDLVTDEIWAAQRASYGYRDVRPHPLIVHFSGLPYVDVRASFNSFVPADIDDGCARRLVDAYLSLLADHPQLHDKVEFDIAFTIWTPCFRAQSEARLLPRGVTPADLDRLEAALRRLTCHALGRLEVDIAPLERLAPRREAILSSRMAPIDRLFAILDDCRRFGTPAFAHAARAGFVAMALLNGMVAAGLIAEERREAFLRGLTTVARALQRDQWHHAQGELSFGLLVARYGHLRPGTYDLTTASYREEPQRYLLHEAREPPREAERFAFTQAEQKAMTAMLRDMGSSATVDELAAFLRAAVEAREAAKFAFSQSVSVALDLCREIAETAGLDRESAAFLTTHDLRQLKLGTASCADLPGRIVDRRRAHRFALLADLPSLIRSEADFYAFEQLFGAPNFITSGRAVGEVMVLSCGEADFSGRVVLIEQADPGYDWLFRHDIAGLVTRFGGANSHMAIRAAELGLPAVIGAGDRLYAQIEAMRNVEIDCANRTVREVI